MNHRQRILAAISQQPVDRTPTDIWATPEVVEKLKVYAGCETFIETWDYLQIDGIVGIAPDYVGKIIETTRQQKVDVRLTESDGCDEVVLCEQTS